MITVSVKRFQPSILGTRLAVVTLTGLRVVVDLHHPSCSRVGETLARGLPIPMSTINTRTVAPALEENTPNDQQAIDGQVYHQNSCDVRRKQDTRHDQADHAISNQHPSKQLSLSLRLDDYRSAVGHNFGHRSTDL